MFNVRSVCLNKPRTTSGGQQKEKCEQGVWWTVVKEMEFYPIIKVWVIIDSIVLLARSINTTRVPRYTVQLFCFIFINKASVLECSFVVRVFLFYFVFYVIFVFFLLSYLPTLVSFFYFFYLCYICTKLVAVLFMDHKIWLYVCMCKSAKANVLLIL